MEARGRIVHEGIRPGNGVVEEAVLAGGGVSEIAHREATIVDPEDLREHECGARFPWDRGDCWVGDCGRDDGAWHYRRVGRETVYLAVVAEIEAHYQAVVVDSLGVDGVRRRRKLLQRAAVGEEEGVRAIAADDVAMAVDPQCRLPHAGVQLGQREGVAGEVGESGHPVPIDRGAGDLTAVADPVRVGARGGAGQRREVEVGERVTTRGDWTTNKRSPGAARGRQQTHQGREAGYC